MLRKCKAILLFFTLLTGIFTQFCFAEPNDAQDANDCALLLQNQAAQFSANPETTSEIEITGEVIDILFTTTDGTIAPVLSTAGVAALPDSIRRELEALYPGQNILTLDWDLLSAQEKQNVIMYSAKVREHIYVVNRKVPGIIFREKIRLEFNKSEWFLGRYYQKGIHTFSSADLFKNTSIEFMGRRRVTESLGFEIHLRRHGKPSENLASAMTLNRVLHNMLGYSDRFSSMQMHMPGPIPIQKLKKEPVRTAFLMTEFYRRVSFYFQTLEIMDGNSLSKLDFKNSDDRLTVVMPVLNREVLVRFNRSLIGISDDFNYGQLAQAAVFNRKSGLVGVRGFGFYDVASLWGLEFRVLKFKDVKKVSPILDSIQNRLLAEDYGLNLPQDFDYNIEALYFSAPHNYLSALDNTLFKEERWKSRPDIRQKLTANLLKYAPHDSENLELGYLLHNWAQDPLLLSRPNELERIREFQFQALMRFAHLKIDDDNYSRSKASIEAVQFFLRKSGLMQLIEGSIEP